MKKYTDELDFSTEWMDASTEIYRCLGNLNKDLAELNWFFKEAWVPSHTRPNYSVSGIFESYSKTVGEVLQVSISVEFQDSRSTATSYKLLNKEQHV